MPNVFELKNVSYTYPDGTKALNKLDLTIPEGKRIAVMGANGCGKSTLFLCLNGVLRPSEGEIRHRGERVTYHKRNLYELRKEVGLVFQDPDTQLFSSSVREEIAFGLLNLGLKQKEVIRRTEEAMERLELSSFRDRPPHFLSGGQKRRVAVADVLAMEPQTVIFDEPFADMDPRNARMMEEQMDLLYKQGKTVIISTHDVDKAYAWADLAAIMDEGRILLAGPPDEIFRRTDILEKANLQRPLILSLYTVFLEKEIISKDAPFPKTPADLVKFLTYKNK